MKLTRYRRVLNMEVEGKSLCVHPRRRWMVCMNEDVTGKKCKRGEMLQTDRSGKLKRETATLLKEGKALERTRVNARSNLNNVSILIRVKVGLNISSNTP
jgi:hypothetical protein